MNVPGAVLGIIDSHVCKLCGLVAVLGLGIVGWCPAHMDLHD